MQCPGWWFTFPDADQFWWIFFDWFEMLLLYYSVINNKHYESRNGKYDNNTDNNANGNGNAK